MSSGKWASFRQTATQFERATNLDIYHIARHYLYKMLRSDFLVDILVFRVLYQNYHM